MLLALLAGAALAAEPGPTQGNLDGAAHMTLPQGYGLAMMEGPDFAVLHVAGRRSGTRLLSVYVGHHPQFPPEGGAMATFGPCLGRVLPGTAGRFDALVELVGPRGIPLKLHLFFRDLAPARERLARETVATLTPAPGFRCVAAN